MMSALTLYFKVHLQGRLFHGGLRKEKKKKDKSESGSDKLVCSGS